MPENSINKIFISKLNYSVTINLKKKELIEKLKKKAHLMTLSFNMMKERNGIFELFWVFMAA